ncbi:3-dehydroquinate dehydratase [Paraliobacillus ryukyuensis]|uniref:3-dehydroquinate dehydratase n=1 Tax=Paraliobacillus ryukyuensis TaxID=200904 RepID=A0A366E6P8_9BACI|nr:type I 3-dehydroquinate dehydratase [Paraliobacillus ryukyuensis]RBO98040.1 3-dehydroquinate dehydratase [Paraliobacillus ryukyuensis]
MKSSIQVRNITIGEGKPKVCVPIVGKTLAEINEALQVIANQQIDLIEWRADFFQAVDDMNQVTTVLKEIRQQLQTSPIIFTFRTAEEGGNKKFSLDAYSQLYQGVIHTGLIDFIDIELFIEASTRNELVASAKQNEVLTIISNHDFAKTPSKEAIINRLKLAQDIGGDVAKIAVMPTNPGDVLTLLEATYTMAETYATIPIITMAMDQLGTLSRTVGGLFGSSVTFASITKSSAPGQVNIKELQQMLDYFYTS